MVDKGAPVVGIGNEINAAAHKANSAIPVTTATSISRAPAQTRKNKPPPIGILRSADPTPMSRLHCRSGLALGNVRANTEFRADANFVRGMGTLTDA